MLVADQQLQFARLHPLPQAAVTISGGFWGRRQAVNREASLAHGYEQLELAGNWRNLRLAAGRESGGTYTGYLFSDSDVYKWLEAVAWEYGRLPDPQLIAWLDEAVELLEAVQQPDGYLNSYYQYAKPGQRWTDLDGGHEMYCAGHLFQAAVAAQRAAGHTGLLRIARRFAEHLWETFGPGQRAAVCGHPEIETALVELFRLTGEPRWLELAGLLIERRGHGLERGLTRVRAAYLQERLPLREAAALEGHAVRQLYLLTGAADLALHSGEPALLAALERLWQDATQRQMYLTGGYGAQEHWEGFGVAYELPAEQAYCETCAAIAAMTWNWRMLLLTGEARFAAALERSLYNNFLSGVALDGRKFLYENPLLSRAGVERTPWHICACCPPNVMRQMATVGHYAATRDAGGVQIHQYFPGQLRVEMGEAGRLELAVETDYPWGGLVKLRVEAGGGAALRLALRIPEWAQGAALRVNGAAVDGVLPGEYAQVMRRWQSGDRIELELPLQPRWTQGSRQVEALGGKLALERGPLVYCFEAPGQAAGVDLLQAQLDPGAPLVESQAPDVLDGVTAIAANGWLPDASEAGLYRPWSRTAAGGRAVSLQATPYYGWAERGRGAMKVWMPVK